jgi:acyl-CoA synthetase (AMP-forming)/AMP-acid ligase II
MRVCRRKSIHTWRKKFGAFRSRVSVLRCWERATPVAHLRVEAKEDGATGVARSQRPVHPTCRACPAQYFARKTFLSTLPTAVSGKVSTNSTCLGVCGPPLRSFTSCISAGDIARADERGYLYIVDRKKDMIVSAPVIAAFILFLRQLSR